MLDVCQVSWTGSFRCLIVSLYNFKWYFKQIIHMNRGQWLGMNFNSRKASTIPIWYANIWKWKKIRTPVFFYINQNKFDISFLQMCYLTQNTIELCIFSEDALQLLEVVETYIKDISKEFKEGLAQIKKGNDEVLNLLSMRLSAVEAENQALHRDVERLNNN